MTIAWVALFGAAGSAARFGISAFLGHSFVATWWVNVTGSFAAGLIAGIAASRPEWIREELRIPLAYGFLGGYTTFSAFSLETARFWRDGLTAKALAYGIATPLACVLLAVVGFALGLQLGNSIRK